MGGIKFEQYQFPKDQVSNGQPILMRSLPCSGLHQSELQDLMEAFCLFGFFHEIPFVILGCGD
jgi:hypothetical protein